MPDSDQQEVERVAALAELLGVSLRPEHAAEVARSWRMMAPHRERVAAVDLGPQAEPAPTFKP